jgi:hypothetical protein
VYMLCRFKRQESDNILESLTVATPVSDFPKVGILQIRRFLIANIQPKIVNLKLCFSISDNIFKICFFNEASIEVENGVAQSVQCLTTDWTTGVRSLAEAKDFSCILCVQTGSGAHPASCTMDTGGPFPGGKARPGRDADHSPVEVKNE